MAQSTLYAVTIGINEYQGPVSDLRGCVADTEMMQQFLLQYTQANDLDFRPHLLLNQQATLDNVIQSFSHFSAAGPGDICVLYYSGHGSEVLAPPELRHLQPDGRLQTLVCHDSRSTSRDLTDKEISQLIWEATTDQWGVDRGAHFLAIFDSCHSGSVSRNTHLRPRLTPGDLSVVPFQQLYGHDQFTGTGERKAPRVGRHVALSAARSYQLAYEKPYHGQPRGVFTQTLLETLQEEQLKGLTYDQLITLVHARMHPDIQYLQNPQHEQLGVWEEEGPPALFGRSSHQIFPHFMVYHPHQSAWILNAGTLQGIYVDQELTVHCSDETKKPVRVREAGIGQSRLLAGDWADPELVYAVAVPRQQEPLLIYWGAGIQEDPEWMAFLAQADQDLIMVTDADRADYRVDLLDDHLLICPVGSERPLFKQVAVGDDREQAWMIFREDLEHVSRWLYLSKKHNPRSALHVLDELAVTLEEYPDFRHDDAPGAPHPVPFAGQIPVFSYRKQGGQWREPVISLTLRRLDHRRTYQGSLWVSILFFNEKYGCTAQHFPVQEFRPGDGEAVQLFYVHRGRRRFYIPLHIPQVFYTDWGETEVRNMFKIVISTEKFTTDDWELSDLKPATRSAKGITRALGGEQSGQETLADWAAYDIPFLIRRPTPGLPLSTGATLTLDQVAVEAPEGFSAGLVRLGGNQEVSRALTNQRMPFNWPGLIEPLNLNPTRQADDALSILELHEPDGMDRVDADHPLRLRLIGAERTPVLPVGYDPELGAFIPLGYTEADGQIRIQRLPPADESTARGLGRSLKIYLQRLKHTRLLGTEDPYPILAVAEPDGDEVVYRRDLSYIRQQVAEAKGVLVVVHGLIGDTSDKKELAYRIKRDDDPQGIPYDLTLTFDYDSLSVPVEETARALKKALEEVDCRKTTSRQVVLVAHSMGGLVSRWMLEEEGGDALVSALVEVGSPNAGSPWASAYDIFMTGIGTAINFLPIPGVINSMLSFLEKAWDQVEVTQQQLRPDSDLVKALNRADKTVPIPYYIVPGDTSLIEADAAVRKPFWQHLVGGLKSRVVGALFTGAHDDIVSVKSMKTVPPGAVTQQEPAACDHFGYFCTEAGLERLSEVLWELGKQHTHGTKST